MGRGDGTSSFSGGFAPRRRRGPSSAARREAVAAGLTPMADDRWRPSGGFGKPLQVGDRALSAAHAVRRAVPENANACAMEWDAGLDEYSVAQSVLGRAFMLGMASTLIVEEPAEDDEAGGLREVRRMEAPGYDSEAGSVAVRVVEDSTGTSIAGVIVTDRDGTPTSDRQRLAYIAEAFRIEGMPAIVGFAGGDDDQGRPAVLTHRFPPADDSRLLAWELALPESFMDYYGHPPEYAVTLSDAFGLAPWHSAQVFQGVHVEADELAAWREMGRPMPPHLLAVASGDPELRGEFALPPELMRLHAGRAWGRSRVVEALPEPAHPAGFAFTSETDGAGGTVVVAEADGLYVSGSWAAQADQPIEFNTAAAMLVTVGVGAQARAWCTDTSDETSGETRQLLLDALDQELARQ